MFMFGTRSLKNLEGVHPTMVNLMKASIADSPLDFAITEGLRTKERQQELYNQGKSLTLLSRHITGHAIDLMVYVEGKGTWEGKYYDMLSKHIQSKADQLGIKIIWGGTFRSLVDKVHFELDKRYYG